jgi:hypothetical protein
VASAFVATFDPIRIRHEGEAAVVEVSKLADKYDHLVD